MVESVPVATIVKRPYPSSNLQDIKWSYSVFDAFWST